MIPGPTEVSKRILKVIGEQVLPHYGEVWKPIYDETINLLRKLFKTSGDIYIIPGAGSLAVEMAAVNLMDERTVAIIPSNGYFGERLQEAFKVYGKVVKVDFEFGKPIDVDKVEETVRRNPEAKILVAVHCETSTGILNPVKELGEIAENYNLIYVVDGISSIGGVEFKMDEWHIDMAFAGPQKCIGALAGITPIALNEKIWKHIENKKIRSWYLNLKFWRDYKLKVPWHPYPSTIPSTLIMALREALLEVFEEGLEKRFKRHRRVAKSIRAGLRELGLKVIAQEEYASPTVTAAITPEKIDSRELIRQLLREHNIMISSGLGEMQEKIIRIGHMANTANIECALKVINAVGTQLNKMGMEIDVKKALEVVKEVYETSS